MQKRGPDRSAPDSRNLAGVLRFQPTDADIDALIAHATAHPLGLEFLKRGELGSVAISFETHAFTVIAARERLSTDTRELRPS
jgi:hypothetical protein